MKQGTDTKVDSLLKREDRKTSQGFVEIKKKTIVELTELIERQNKLLKNKSFLEKLPDKGSKILSFKAELESEIENRKKHFAAEYDAACQLLTGLSLNNNRNADDIEWQEGNAAGKQLDSDDEEEEEEEEEQEISPLKIIATHSGTASGKSIKISSPERKSVLNDLSNAKKLSYVEKFCEKYEKSSNCKERFKPNQLKNNNKTLFFTSTENVKKRLGSKWEVTQATPPVPIYKDTVMITLTESLKLQKEQAEKLKEIEKKHAVEKLMQNMSLKMGDKLPVHNITEYRGSRNPFEESAEDDENNESSSDDERHFTKESNELES